MGSPFSIILYHEDSAIAGKLADTAFAMVDSLVNIYSNYIGNSELNRLSASAGSGRFVKLSPALFDILQASQTAYKRSHHAFDITVGPLTDLWRSARKENKFPTDSIIQQTKALTGFHHIKLNRRDQAALLRTPGMKLDLGGIAQGYIAEKVKAYIIKAGSKSVLVDVSGDIALGDAPPARKGWVVGVNLPGQGERLQEKKLSVSNTTVSTSGDVYQYMMHEGKKYSHIINPVTGYGVTTGKNVTVIVKDATVADWLATACSILPVKAAKRLARKMKAELMLADIQDGVLETVTTKNFKKYWQ